MDTNALITLAIAAVTIGGGGMAGYYAGRIDTNDRITDGKDDIRKWVEENFVSRKEMLAEIRAIHSDFQLQQERTALNHNENRNKLDSVESNLKDLVNVLKTRPERPSSHGR